TNNVNCYDSIARFEIKLNGKKIVGSAQRRLKRGILQHGSILFENNQHLLKYLLVDKKDNPESLVEKFHAVKNVFDEGIDKKTIEKALINGFKNSIVKDFYDYNISDSYMEALREKEKEYLVYKSKNNMDY
ncbi:MAG: lipoate--protein ligase family protein, partial [bacterium]|nr:lipoate--protein ligase family protein [bacterium]